MDLDREFRNFSTELQQNLAEQGTQVQETLIGLQEKCYTYAGNNGDKFVSCMYDTTKRLEKEQRKLELKTAFYQAKLGECFEANKDNADGIKKCKQTTIENLKKSFIDFANNVKN